MGFSISDQDFIGNKRVILSTRHPFHTPQLIEERIYVDGIIEIEYLEATQIIKRIVLSQVIEVDMMLKSEPYQTAKRAIDYPHKCPYLISYFSI